MDSKLLKSVINVAAPILLIGIGLFLKGFFESGSSIWTPIGIGTVMGSIFIFLMGMFLIATDEVLEKRYKGKRVAPLELE
ncbi:hypothetical protein [Peribacillus kribbensis]|uniref:hypothetical protein n=1 Tax=Peribacillus kribbensis TaxID=356658 RepID=UPI00040F0D43|nr:hypothetical protein [Peribacillus kribbensis]